MHKYFKELRTLLIRNYVPLSTIRKTIAELRDHAEELIQSYKDEGHPREIAENLAIEKLGRKEIIVERLIAENRNCHFAGRHPIFNFLILPFALMTLIPPIIMVLSLFISLGLILSRGPISPIVLGFTGIEYFCIYGLFLLITIRVCFLILNNFRGIRWVLYSISIMALNGFFFYWKTSLVLPSDTESGSGQYGIFNYGYYLIINKFYSIGPISADFSPNFSPNLYMGMTPFIIFIIFALWYQLQARKMLETD